VTESGTILLPKSAMESILKVAGGDTLAFKTEDRRVLIRAGSAKWSLQTDDPDTFPSVPGFSATAYHTLTAPDFKRLAKRTLYATDPQSSSFALGGVSMEPSAASFVFVALDGRQVAAQTVPAAFVGELADDKVTRIIPESTVNGLQSIVSDTSSVDLGFPDANTAQFRFGDTVYTSRLMVGRFPKWKLAVPSECNHRFRTRCGPYRSAIEQASAVLSNEGRRIRFRYESTVVRIAGEASDHGDSDVEFPITWEGEPLAVAVKSDYLIDMLKSIDSEMEIDCEFQDANTNIVIRSDDGFFGMIAIMTWELPDQ
jgi:DNA polymerase-3 subunit beta